MAKKLIALLLVLTMALSLAACGGGNSNGVSNGSNTNDRNSDNNENGTNGENSVNNGNDTNDGNGVNDGSGDSEQNDGETPTPPPGPIIPGFPVPDGGSGGTEQSGGQEAEEPGIAQESVTLFFTGQTVQLTVRGVTEQGTVTYTSGDESVASVDGNGRITAKAAGDTEIAIHLEMPEGAFDFNCPVHCLDTGTPTISAFFDGLKGAYEAVASLSPLEGEVLESDYPGLASAEGVEEALVMEPVISFSSVAVALVKLADNASASQIQAVEEILQARLDSQASGGAYYLSAQETWGQGVVVSCGNYVGMFVCSGEAQNFADYFTSTYSR